MTTFIFIIYILHLFFIFEKLEFNDLQEK